MKHPKGTPECIKPLIEKRLQEAHVRIARKIGSVSHPTSEWLEKLAEVCIDHDIKAAWKNRGEGRREGKNQTVAPGNPTVAGFILLNDATLERLYNRRMRYEQRFNNEVDAEILKAEQRLRNYEFPEDAVKKTTLSMPTKTA